MKKIWNKIKHWCCKVGLCNLDKCNCDCHRNPKGRSKAYYTTVKKEKLPPLPPRATKAVKKVRHLTLEKFNQEVTKVRTSRGVSLTRARAIVNEYSVKSNS